ncbi:MAG: 2,3-bisphosphoglycerate-independent phosphoglycerate mutase [Proteobacteria bacterium]|nr:MAG: 2,3-bisphosphoglycerate-independent phosphoglycerate mutase [Pseudomonadota bacterium]
MPQIHPTLLVILDGFGINPDETSNGIAIAGTPKLDAWFDRYPHTQLQTSGRAVGLPEGQMGNSEVGHMTIGSGSIIRQYLVRIDDAIADGSLYLNTTLNAAINAAPPGGNVHLLGMVSDGGVHSHIDHLLALVQMVGKAGRIPVVHMITDGRDTAPKCAQDYLPPLETALAAAGGRIAVVSGRYYAMDRDQRWERTELAFRALVNGAGRTAATAREAIDDAHARDESDEFIVPTVIGAATPISADDPVIFFNFRNDRTRQMTAALSQRTFDAFDRGDFQPVVVTCLTEYDPAFKLPVAFEKEVPQTTLAEIISNAGLKQFHCAETEKYAHVTFFLNGGHEAPVPGEVRVMIPSPRVATYDLQPEMSAHEVTDACIAAIESGDYAFIVVNYANCDMVGHTAVREAILKAVRTVDDEVSRLLDSAVAHGFSALISADHGNCEEMVDPVTNNPQTQHTLFPVPCLVVDDRPWTLRDGGGLANIAPTILELMGLEIPTTMTGESLLVAAGQPEATRTGVV